MAINNSGLPLVSACAVQDLLSSLSLPKPISIEPLDSSTGAYHSIYIITYDAATSFIIPGLGQDKIKRLVLRISAGELPRVKTMNEVAMIKWVRETTSIPAPAVVAFDCTSNNALGNEYSITEFVTGKPLSEVYQTVKDQDLLINQLIDYLLQLYDKPFDHVGGLQVAESGFIPGPMTEWHFWTTKDTKYWSDPLSMNAAGPFDSHASYCIATMKKSKEAIDTHDSLALLRSLPIDQLLQAIAQKHNIATSRYVLAHRDLHFGNIMFDTEQQKITGIIDWELAAILPYQLWNPGNFLWTANEGKQADEDRSRFTSTFERLCHERKATRLLDISFSSQEQEKMQKASTLLRNLINALLRGWQEKRATEYEAELRSIIEVFVGENSGKIHEAPCLKKKDALLSTPSTCLLREVAAHADAVVYSKQEEGV